MDLVDPRAIVDPRASLGSRCRLGPFCIVEAGVEIGDDAILEPFSRVCTGTTAGRGLRLGQGAVLGGLAQVRGVSDGGLCRVGSGVRIGEYATVHRSSSPDGETVLGDETMVLAYAHVAHDCVLAERVVLANGVQLGGHVRVERDAFLGGGAHVHQFVRIGEMAFVAGRLRLDKDLAPWSRGMGEPPRWAGLNRVALDRAPDPPDRKRVEKSLRILFRSGLRLDEALGILSEVEGPEARALALFAEGGRRGLLRPEG